MSALATRPLVISVLLHASVIGLLVVLMLRVQRETVATPVIIDWISEPRAAVAPIAHESISPRATSVSFAPVRVVAPTPVADNEPEIPVTPTAQARSEVRPAPAVAPTASRTTIAEHRRRNSSSASPARTGAPARTAAPAVARIDVEQVLASGSQSGAQATAVDPRRVASYWETLVSRLRAAHQKPAELDEGLSVRVEFVLSESGAISGVRVVSSSGSAEFDASVVAAFGRLRGLTAPPAGAAGVNQLTFCTRVQ